LHFKGAVILEAYGQTEVTAGITATLPDDTEVGHVGALLPNCWVKLADVPELEYYTADEQGEICVKGPCFPKGYFKEPEKTAELFDQQGWLHTGDIGMWTPRGTLKIIDRKKNILKLAQGEYVAPEKIENVYSRCPFVSQIFVDGRSLETYLVAIVVPNKEEIRQRIEKKHQFQFSVVEKYEDSRQFWTNERLIAKVLEEMRSVGKKNGLNSLEQVKAIKFYYEESFTVENGLLTPTFKLKRPQLKKKFVQDIDDLYKI
uniref:long-chain-fatty-acid--CoA ligase n=1 Tax=Romanomermis culicivorax TaxID=13658 RepID=A0A915KK18_ROMCU